MSSMNDEIVINIPFSKVNKEKRTVTGIATADNVDLEDDVVEFSTAIEAFGNWVGNIREMHAPIAVGKAVDFRPATVVGKDGNTYNGVEVEAYISKGAENTWLKVLDKTLGGFSIGGVIRKAEEEFDAKTGRKVRKIKKMDLLELSLVDNPANPLAMLSMIKSNGGGKLEVQPGFEGESHKIFYCTKDEVAKSDNSICSYCNEEMDLLGFADHFEVEVVKSLISKFHKENGGVSNLTKNENNDTIVDMDTEITDSQKQSLLKRLGDTLFGSDKVEDNVLSTNGLVLPNINLNFAADGFSKSYTASSNSVLDTFFKGEDVVTEDEVVTDEIEDASEDEVTKSNDKEDDVDMDMEKFMDGISTLLDEKMSAFKQEVTDLVDDKVSDVQKSVDSVTEKIDEQGTSLEEVTGKVDEVAKSGAVKKSNDVVDDDELDEEIEKSLDEGKSESFWGGLFVPAAASKILGYDS